MWPYGIVFAARAKKRADLGDDGLARLIAAISEAESITAELENAGIPQSERDTLLAVASALNSAHWLAGELTHQVPT